MLDHSGNAFKFLKFWPVVDNFVISSQLRFEQTTVIKLNETGVEPWHCGKVFNYLFGSEIRVI